jgi:hypothetical protein
MQEELVYLHSKIDDHKDDLLELRAQVRELARKIMVLEQQNMTFGPIKSPINFTPGGHPQ